MKSEDSRLIDEVTRAINKVECLGEDNQIKLKLNETTGDYEFEDPTDMNYTSICYLIALNVMSKANKLQRDNGITGYQHGIIANLIYTLMRDRPLSPIEDKEDEWTCIAANRFNGDSNDKFEETVYQSRRCNSLFKHVSINGEVRYHDNNRFAYHEKESSALWSGHLIDKIGESIYGPIAMPYMPKDTIVFEVITFDSVKGEPGSYDTMCVYNAKNGAPVFMNADNNTELTKEEFLSRYESYRRAAEKNNQYVKQLDMDYIK